MFLIQKSLITVIGADGFPLGLKPDVVVSSECEPGCLPDSQHITIHQPASIFSSACSRRVSVNCETYSNLFPGCEGRAGATDSWSRIDKLDTPGTPPNLERGPGPKSPAASASLVAMDSNRTHSAATPPHFSRSRLLTSLFCCFSAATRLVRRRRGP